ncbi:MAG TPA: cytochrome c [Gemmatimonadales bacterium]|nr:cytochrome c [Gemmatimonadales bacterium]
MTRVRAGRFLALASLLHACERRSGPPPAVDPGPVPAELAEGERLFNDTCARCHGPLAIGTDSGPPLVHVIYEPSHHGDIAFQRAAALGVASHHWRFGDMPPVPGVDEAAVARITAYVRWLQRKAGIE